MIEKVLRTTFVILFIALGVVLAVQLRPFLPEVLTSPFWIFGAWGVTLVSILCVLFGAILGYLIGMIASPYLLRKLRDFAILGERTLTVFSMTDLLLGTLGLFLGLIIANLLGLAFSNLPIFGPYVSIILSIILGYTGMHLAVSQKSQAVHWWNNLRISREKDSRLDVNQYGKILDTSVIIDGRISDIAQTGFLEGPLAVPVFVLEELQHIADSADVLKRNRGRRGLDILNQMQKKKIIPIRIVTEDFEEIAEVDSKLIQLALKHQAPIITNDYNLNKVAELQGVTVLNINDLANSVKPVVIPGEGLHVQIIKTGKEEGQGVAYLEDGTMIVVENGREKIGEEVYVIVTSVLQTSAGKMIFAKYE